MSLPSDQSQYSNPANIINTPQGKAKWVPLQTFVDDLLPPLPNSLNVDRFIAKLARKRGPNRQIITKGGFLWGYSQKYPSDYERSRAYHYLYTCAERIVQAVPSLTATFQFEHNNDNPWDLCDRNECTLPDAYIRRRKAVDSPVSWPDVAVSGVYTRYDTPELAKVNMQKIVQCMSNCITRDPRRRFTYGYTIEDTTMRLWYCDRVSIFMSQTFDFVAGYIWTIRFILSCFFAEEHALGFDPTMVLYHTLEDGSSQYDVALRSDDGLVDYYRTLDILYDGGSTLSGRGTRVWKAVKLENGKEIGKAVVLKDCWADYHREREAVRHRGIRRSAASDEQAGELQAALIGIVAAGDVYVGGALDRTRDPFEEEGPKKRRLTPSFWVPAQPDDVQVHTRVVYDEVGMPIRRVESLSSYFRALAQVVEDVQVLHRLGWTHCDISTGNVLLTESGAKLTDVEYARCIRNPEPYDMGTRDFKAVEVQMRITLFMDDDKTEAGRPPTFYYHPLHDLESVWWLGAHFLLARAVIGSTDEDAKLTEQYRRQHMELAAEIFGRGERRHSVMTTGGFFVGKLKQLHPSVREVGERLQQARLALIKAYKKAEDDIYNIDFTAADGIHEMLRDCFSSIATMYTTRDVQMERLSY